MSLGLDPNKATFPQLLALLEKTSQPVSPSSPTPPSSQKTSTPTTTSRPQTPSSPSDYLTTSNQCARALREVFASAKGGLSRLEVQQALKAKGLDYRKSQVIRYLREEGYHPVSKSPTTCLWYPKESPAIVANEKAEAPEVKKSTYLDVKQAIVAILSDGTSRTSKDLRVALATKGISHQGYINVILTSDPDLFCRDPHQEKVQAHNGEEMSYWSLAKTTPPAPKVEDPVIPIPKVLSGSLRGKLLKGKALRKAAYDILSAEGPMKASSLWKRLQASGKPCFLETLRSSLDRHDTYFRRVGLEKTGSRPASIWKAVNKGYSGETVNMIESVLVADMQPRTSREIHAALKGAIPFTSVTGCLSVSGHFAPAGTREVETKQGKRQIRTWAMKGATVNLTPPVIETPAPEVAAPPPETSALKLGRYRLSDTEPTNRQAGVINRVSAEEFATWEQILMDALSDGASLTRSEIEARIQKVFPRRVSHTTTLGKTINYLIRTNSAIVRKGDKLSLKA